MEYTNEFIKLAKTKASDEEWKPLGLYCYEFGQPSIVIRIIFMCWRNLSRRLEAIEAAICELQQRPTPLPVFPTQDATPLKSLPSQS